MPFLVTRSERRLLSHKTTISCKPSDAFCNDGPTRSDTPRVTASCRWCSCGFQQLAVPQQSAAYQIQCQTSQSRCTESAMADNLRIAAAMSRASAKTLPRITLPADASFEISVGIHTGILEFLGAQPRPSKAISTPLPQKKDRLFVVHKPFFEHEQRA